MKKSKILISILLFMFFHFTAIAIEYSGAGGKPAFPNPDNPRTSSIIIHTTKPGETIEEGVQVINNTDETKTFLIYATDTANSGNGGFACKQFSELNDNTGTWISPQKSKIILAPKTSKIIPFTISIPENAGVGEHNGCIAIQEKPTISRINESGGIKMATRVAIRIAITIPGEIVKNAEITNFVSTSNIFGGETITISSKNNGNVSVDGKVKIPVKNIWGKTLHTFEGEYPIIRDGKEEWNFDFKQKFWGGLYTASATLEYNDNPSTELGIIDEETITTLTVPDIKFFMFPSIVGLLTEIFILIFIFSAVTLSITGIKRYYRIKNEWVPYKIQPGDEIKELAKKLDISWDLLADANDLEPPYSLHELKTILVPPQNLIPQKQPKATKTAKPPNPSKKTSSTSIQQEPLSKNDTEK